MNAPLRQYAPPSTTPLARGRETPRLALHHHLPRPTPDGGMADTRHDRIIHTHLARVTLASPCTLTRPPPCHAERTSNRQRIIRPPSFPTILRGPRTLFLYPLPAKQRPTNHTIAHGAILSLIRPASHSRVHESTYHCCCLSLCCCYLLSSAVAPRSLVSRIDFTLLVPEHRPLLMHSSTVAHPGILLEHFHD